MRFTDKITLVTGGAKGIGKAVVKAFAAVVLFLASEESSYITGHAVGVDGGNTFV